MYLVGHKSFVPIFVLALFGCSNEKQEGKAIDAKSKATSPVTQKPGALDSGLVHSVEIWPKILLSNQEQDENFRLKRTYQLYKDKIVLEFCLSSNTYETIPFVRIKRVLPLVTEEENQGYKKNDPTRKKQTVYTPLCSEIVAKANEIKLCGLSNYELNHPTVLPSDCFNESIDMMMPIAVLNGDVMMLPTSKEGECVGILPDPKNSKKFGIALSNRDDITYEKLRYFAENEVKEFQDGEFVYFRTEVDK